jgi:hypothetical protein
MLLVQLRYCPPQGREQRGVQQRIKQSDLERAASSYAYPKPPFETHGYRQPNTLKTALKKERKLVPTAERLE